MRYNWRLGAKWYPHAKHLMKCVGVQAMPPGILLHLILVKSRAVLM